MLGRWQTRTRQLPLILTINISEPCMRGHRSSKCTHEDRLLVQVRKPGRPLSSCPHLAVGTGGTTTFVDANGARLDDTTSTHGHGAGEKPCGCEVTSLAIPKVASCACSFPQPPSSTTKPTSKSSLFELRIYPHQHFKSRVLSPPTSPVSPVAVCSAASQSSSGRISKVTKKRKSSSVSGEAIIQIVGRESLLKIAGQQDAIENRTIAERTAEPLCYAGEDIHLTGTQLSNEHDCISPGQESDIRQFQSKEATTHHDSPNAIFNNAAVWRQDNSRPETVPRHSAADPVAFPQPKPCCNGCESKPAQLVPVVAHNHQLLNQTQLQAPLPCGLSQVHPMYHESMQHMQPIATTVYTYPNGYTTINNPLTPQELRMLQATGAWSTGASAAWSGLGVETIGNGMDAEYACSCGPGCECLGCAAHPFNTSTVNFVKDMRTMMYSGRHGAPPRRQNAVAEHSTAIHGVPRQTCCGGGTQQSNTMANPVSYLHPDLNSLPASMNYRAVHNHQGFEHMPSSHDRISPPHHHLYVSSPHSLQQQQIIDSLQPNNIPTSNSPLSQHSVFYPTNRPPTPQHTIRPHHCRQTAPLSISSPTYTSSSSPDPTNGGDDTETEQNTVSPSGYFHIDYPLGLCSDNDMGCLCGDDCACVDCMLHRNNVPDFRTTVNGPVEPEASPAQTLTSASVNAESRACGGGGANNSGNGVQAGLVEGPQGRGLSNGATNSNPQHQSSSGQVPSNIHQRRQIHALLEGIHDQEIVDGQSVYVWG
ncbi:hypothetical protein BGX38DRAFT_784935 [Terfezia claveryi]|nr:hypothetical protein BGX38DRAFT_784935 [Terfezia claveryi]